MYLLYCFDLISGLILTGRGLGDVISEKQLRNQNSVNRSPEKKAAVSVDVTDGLLVPPAPPLFLNGSKDHFDGETMNLEGFSGNAALTPRAVEVRRIMHQRASMYGGSEDVSNQLLAELLV